MTRIAYIGKKQREDAYMELTGIAWTPGAVHDIPADVASNMLRHPDVFDTEEGVAVRAASKQFDPKAARADGTVLVAIDCAMFAEAQEAGAIGVTEDGYPLLLPDAGDDTLDGAQASGEQDPIGTLAAHVAAVGDLEALGATEDKLLPRIEGSDVIDDAAERATFGTTDGAGLIGPGTTVAPAVEDPKPKPAKSRR